MTNIPDSPAEPDHSTTRRWRVARRLLLAAAALVTLLAVFYTVENWRGKRAWENCRRDLEARGEVLDWAKFIPAPVPDDQNFFKAPKMQEWFVKESDASPGFRTPSAFSPAPRKATNLVLADVKVIVSGAALDSQPAEAVLRFDDLSARERVAQLLRETLGPCVIGPRMCILLAQPLEQLKPLHLVLQAGTLPSVKELTAFFPGNPLTNLALAYSALSYIRVDAAGSNSFRVSLKEPVYGAADYLAWTDSLTPDFDLVRKALERPYARIDCDYRQPFAIGIPNFISIRQVAQIVSERAQSYLLLGQPEAAWHELALVHDLCRILEARPAGKPVTLVGAMINVAVAGLYVGIVEDGLRLHAWREPQLVAIERQLHDTDLLAPVVEAFREERAGIIRTFETTRPGELVKLFDYGSSPRSWREGLDASSFKLILTCMPRGWFHQNMAAGAEMEQQWLPCVDVTNRLVQAQKASETMRLDSREFEHHSPYTLLVSKALPNYLKAVQTMARNQTLVNQAQLACVLERYRLAQGQFPVTLDALTPRFIERLPHDLIGGQPLKYRTEGGAYVLYSVGWNEKDDGGIPGNTRDEGDWVWGLQ
jgi:hypothetical protein